MRAWAVMLAAVALVPWAAAWVPGGKWWLPIVAAAIVFPGFAARVRTGQVLAAWRWAMAWAVALGASVIVLTQCAADAAAGAIWRGPDYRDEMLAWITSGSGREGSPALFLPQHALHLAVFLVLCVLTGGFLGLSLGAALTAYMSFFVGSFASLAGEPVWGSLVAWFPWSVARVAAFVLLGVLAARPLLTAKRWPYDRTDRRWLAWVAAGLAADVLLKTLLAPSYGRWFAAWLSG